jgi:radical SAM superfamily enzyme YgiQ (UPF0313 family)
LKKVLFVNAVDPNSEIQNRYRPLWPAYLAAHVEKDIGLNKFEFKFMTDRFENELESFNPDIVGISAVSQNFNYAKKYAATAKEKGVTVIVGGIHISYLPECLTRDMDVACLGESEKTFSELMQLYLDTGSPPEDKLKNIDGITYWNKGKRVQTADRKLLKPEQMIRPQRSVIGYQRHDYIFTSRGCPYKCIFCASTRYWDNVRYAPIDMVLQEIEELMENGVKVISFYDDLFIANRKRLHELSKAIIEKGFNKKLEFTCSCRANTVQPDKVEALKLMNVVSVGMGLESGAERILKYLKGGCSVEDNYEAINMFKDVGIQVNASFIIGVVDETEDEIMETYDFIRKSRLDFFDIYLLTPYPGTPIWSTAIEKKLVFNDMDWSRLDINTSPENPKAIIFSHLDKKKLTSLYKKFRRLRLFRIIIALPRSPWLRDVPKVLYGILKEKFS